MIKTFKQFLSEAKNVRIYHGGKSNITALNPLYMNKGNVQEGIGTYFSDDIKTAHQYGPNIIYAEINPKRFINSRMLVNKLNYAKVLRLLELLSKQFEEEFYYFITNYGIDVAKIVTRSQLLNLYVNIKYQEIRNFQIALADAFSVESFVALWNKIFDEIDGTYYAINKSETWYVIINPAIKVYSV